MRNLFLNIIRSTNIIDKTWSWIDIEAVKYQDYTSFLKRNKKAAPRFPYEEFSALAFRKRMMFSLIWQLGLYHL